MRTQRRSENLNPRARPIITCEVKATMHLCLINPLNAELNPICHLLALLGVHHFLHVSTIRVKQHAVAPEGVKVRIHAFLTSTLDRVEKSLSLRDRFTRANSSSGIYWG